MLDVELLRAIQSISSPFWDQFFFLWTELHSETAYLILIPVLYWVFHKRFALNILSLFVVGQWFNWVLQAGFAWPRPSPSDVRVVWPESATLPYSFPSGHAQSPATIWISAALWIRKRWFTVLACVFVFFIGFSRLYGGLHYPIDVLTGWALGALTAWGAFWGLKYTTRWMKDWALWQRLIPAVVLPPALLLIFSQADELFAMAGAWMGIWVGSLLDERFVKYDPKAYSKWRLGIHAVSGLALLLALRVGLKPVLGEGDPATYVRYVIIGLGVSFLAPWLFTRFGKGPVSSRDTQAL